MAAPASARRISTLPHSPTLNGGPLPSKYYTSDHARSNRDDEIEMYSAKLVYTKGWGTITGVVVAVRALLGLRYAMRAPQPRF